MRKLGVAFMIIGGCILVGAGFGMDTTVDAGFGERVHNIGLMNEKQNILLVGATLAIIGTILVGFASRAANSTPSDGVTEDTRQCPHCAETIKKQAVVCRFCHREIAAVVEEIPLSHDELMALYGISHDGEMYQYEQYRYQNLEDAVAYAQMQRQRT